MRNRFNRIVGGLLLAVALLLAGCAKESAGPVVVTSAPALPESTVTAEALLPLVGGEGGATSSPTVQPSAPYPAPDSATAVDESSYPSPGEGQSIQDTAYPEPAATPEPAPTAALTAPNLADLDLQLEQVVSSLDLPVAVVNSADGSQRLFVVEKKGRIRIVRDGALEQTPFLDISDRVGSESSEQGLLGLAFDPSWVENRYFFVNYTDRAGNTVISRFSADAGGEQGDPASEEIILTQQQPAANHNGGNLVFGPDGYLYIGLGDGGAAGDQFGNGQNGQTWLGAMLRLDVSQIPYQIPLDNPFIADPDVRDEIWAIGLRNPWRYSFDRATGELYIADVGQDKYEEIDVQPAASPGGENYGWPLIEGSHCFPDETANCDQNGLQLPVVEYDHGQGCSVTGGYVYRGSRYPALTGVYLFGDYCSGRVWGLAQIAPGDWQVVELAQTGLRISTFGEDESGEIYLADIDQGKLFRLTLP